MDILFSFISIYAIVLAIFIFTLSITRSNFRKRHNFGFQDNSTISLIGIISGFFAGIIIIVLSNNYGLLLISFDDDDYKLLLSSTATIIGTILAVSFSILILGIQHALGSYSPSIIRYFVVDRSTITCFFILSSSTIFCLYGLVLPWKSNIITLSLFMLPYCFVVLIYYYYTRSRTTTLSLFDKMKNDANSYLQKKLEKKLETQFKSSLSNPVFQQGRLMIADDDHNSFVASIVKDNLFHNGNILQPLRHSMRDITGLIHRSLHSNDDESVQYGLDTISEIIQQYISIRRDSSDDKFIQSVYEQIKAITYVSKDKNNSYLLNKIVETYGKIGIITNQIDLSSGTTNQMAAMAIYYLNEIFYMDDSFDDTKLEVVRTIRKISISTILNGGDDAMSLSNYSKMVENSKDDRFYLLYQQIIFSTSSIISSSIDMKNGKISLKMQLDLLDNMTSQILNRLSEGHSNLALLPLIENSAGFPFNFHTMISKLIKLKNLEDEENTKRALEKHAFDTVPHILKSLMRICFDSAKVKYSMIIKGCISTVHDVIITLMEEKYLLILTFDQDVHSILDAMAKVYVSYFEKDAPIGGMLFDAYFDILTLLGLKFIELGKIDLAKFVLELILRLCRHTAKIDEYGYDTARVTKRIVLIGVYATEMKSKEVSRKASEILKEYDVKFKEIAKAFQKRPDLNEVKKEMDEYDEILEISSQSPKRYLKGKLANTSWSKFKKLSESQD